MGTNYRSIAKANALFGGVQAYSILIGIVRSKLVAVLLGAEGMGILGLFNSTVDLVKGATNLGIQTSAVRDVSIATSEGNSTKVSEVYTVISKIVWYTGILGLLVMLIFARELSSITFATESYTLQFRILSIVLLISQLTVVNQVMMQGMRKLKALAMSNVVGNTIGLLLIIPLYYFWGYKAIVLSIIITYLVTYVVSSLFFWRYHVAKSSLSLMESLIRGKQMMVLGFMLSLTGLMDVVQIYFVKIFIAQVGSVSDVGLYNAGFSIIVGYASLVFSSIGTDYYPRLTTVCNNADQCNDVVNDQMEIMLLVLIPLVALFIVFSKFFILLLYTEEFLAVTVMVNWMAAGMIQRAISWCPGFLYVAKGDSKLYLIIYIVTFIVTSAMYLGFYYLWGLTGIGIAFFSLYFIGNFTTFWITSHYYNYKLRNQTIVMILMTTALSILILLLSFVQSMYAWIAMAFCVLFCIYYSYKGLNERLNLTLFIKSKFGKK